ncbi:MAG: hypothetical protein ABIP49_04430 [Lysobacterales bacterium]
MSLLHITAAGAAKVPKWLLNSPGLIQQLSSLKSLAFIAATVTDEDGKARSSLDASHFSLLLMATPGPVDKQGVTVKFIREESLKGCYSLIVAPKPDVAWPDGDYLVSLRVKHSSPKQGGTILTRDGRTLVHLRTG